MAVIKSTNLTLLPFSGVHRVFTKAISFPVDAALSLRTGLFAADILLCAIRNDITISLETNFFQANKFRKQLFMACTSLAK